MDMNWVWKVESYPGVFTGIYYEVEDGKLYFYFRFPFRQNLSSRLSLKKKYKMGSHDEICLNIDPDEVLRELIEDLDWFKSVRKDLRKLELDYTNRKFNYTLRIDALQLLIDNFEEIRPMINKIIVKEML